MKQHNNPRICGYSLLGAEERTYFDRVVELWQQATVDAWPKKIVIVEDESQISEGHSAGWHPNNDVIIIAKKNSNNFSAYTSLYKELMTMLCEKFRRASKNLVKELNQKSRWFEKRYKRYLLQVQIDNHPDKLAKTHPELVPADNFGHVMVKFFWNDEDKKKVLGLIRQVIYGGSE